MSYSSYSDYHQEKDQGDYSWFKKHKDDKKHGRHDDKDDKKYGRHDDKDDKKHWYDKDDKKYGRHDDKDDKKYAYSYDKDDYKADLPHDNYHSDYVADC